MIETNIVASDLTNHEARIAEYLPNGSTDLETIIDSAYDVLYQYFINAGKDIKKFCKRLTLGTAAPTIEDLAQRNRLVVTCSTFLGTDTLTLKGCSTSDGTYTDITTQAIAAATSYKKKFYDLYNYYKFSMAATKGEILTASIDNVGSGYSEGDVLTVVQSGATLGTFSVESIGVGGTVASISAVAAGSNYSVANGLSTTVAPSGGTGAKINVLTITPSTVTAYLVESNFELAHLYLSLSMAYREIVSLTNSNWREKADFYMGLYQTEIEGLLYSYDVDDDGEVEAGETNYDNRVTFTR